MANGGPVTVRVPSALEIVRAVPTTLTAPLYYNGVVVVATTVTASVVGPTGTALTLGTDPSVVASVATWVVTIPTDALLGVGYRVEWVITHAGGTVRFVQSMAVVSRHLLYPVITDRDLYSRQNLLNPSHHATIAPSDITTWQDQLDEAWVEILGRIWGLGRRPALVLSPDALRAPHLYLTLALIYEGPCFRVESERPDYRTMYDHAWASVRWVYDENDDGAPDAKGERVSSIPAMWLV